MKIPERIRIEIEKELNFAYKKHGKQAGVPLLDALLVKLQSFQVVNDCPETRFIKEDINSRVKCNDRRKIICKCLATIAILIKMLELFEFSNVHITCRDDHIKK